MLDMLTSKPLVLVADDEPSMLELVARRLVEMREPTLEVISARDGDEAWRLAREHLPDLVVLDVMMPGMSGWEVCRKIREDVALAHTGVVMLTGIGENLNQLTSPLYGADTFIDKPFDFDEFDDKVRATLDLRAKQREGVSRPSLNGSSAGAGPASNGAPKKGPSTKEAARKATGKKAAQRAPAKKATAKKVVAKKATAKKATAKKATAKKVVAKKAIAKAPVKAPARKVSAKAPTVKAPVKAPASASVKVAAKKVSTKKASGGAAKELV